MRNEYLYQQQRHLQWEATRRRKHMFKFGKEDTGAVPQVSSSSTPSWSGRWRANFKGDRNLFVTWSRPADTRKHIRMGTANDGIDSVEYPTPGAYPTPWQEYYYSAPAIRQLYNGKNRFVYEHQDVSSKKNKSENIRIHLNRATASATNLNTTTLLSTRNPKTSSMICSRQGACRRQPVVSFCATTSSQPSTLPNPILRATLIGAFATAAAQLVGCPIDVISKLAAKNMPGKLMLAGKLVRSNGIAALYKGLPFHLMKRTPTKALTVCLFEVFRTYKPPTTKAGHIKTALLSGMLALAATYPATVLYYGTRKAIPFTSIMDRIRKTSGGVLYAGFIPSVFAVAPSVTIDYGIYRATREHLIPSARASDNTSNGNTTAFPLGTIMVAAAVSNMVAGGFAEPLKMIARRSAVSALKGGNSTRMVAMELLRGGPGEFWRGFPNRSLRYALTAVVSKSTVQHLRDIDTVRA